MPTYLDEDDLQEILYLHKYGHSKKLLCKMFKIGVSTLNKVLAGEYKATKFDRPIGEHENAG